MLEVRSKKIMRATGIKPKNFRLISKNLFIMSKELENRLIGFSSMIINLGENLKDSYTSSQLSKQIIRSGISCSLNYGEAQNAESRKDFIHKNSIVLKELRETLVNLKLIKSSDLMKEEITINRALAENDELVAIFTRLILTAKKNMV
jgi:four helix bundle protein